MPSFLKISCAWLVLAFALAGCTEQPTAKRPNIVMIVVDTLRHDRLGCQGADRNTTPVLDALAARGVRFDAAYSTAPWTCPSVASILTGQLPTTHGLIAPLTGVADEVETLAEMLSAEGYATAGVISNPHLRKRFAFDQGFESWEQSHARGHKNISTPGVTRQATSLVKELASSEKPFFLFVLYFDPHYDYKRHPRYRFARDPGRIRGDETIHELRELAEDMTPSEVQYLRDVYDEEIRFTDDGIGRLLVSLRRAGVADNTTVIMTADHGEEFLERGWLGHCRTLYDELVHVPLIIQTPNLKSPRVVNTPVSVISLVPTVLELVGLPVPPGLIGPSLVPFLEGRDPESWPPVVCEVDFTPVGTGPSEKDKEAHKRSLVRDNLKVIHDDVSGELELYDLLSDPLEKVNLAEEQPGTARELFGLLERMQEQAKEGAITGVEVQLSEEEIEELRGLGYATPGATEPNKGK